MWNANPKQPCSNERKFQNCFALGFVYSLTTYWGSWALRSERSEAGRKGAETERCLIRQVLHLKLGSGGVAPLDCLSFVSYLKGLSEGLLIRFSSNKRSIMLVLLVVDDHVRAGILYPLCSWCSPSSWLSSFWVQQTRSLSLGWDRGSPRHIF